MRAPCFGLSIALGLLALGCGEDDDLEEVRDAEVGDASSSSDRDAKPATSTPQNDASDLGDAALGGEGVDGGTQYSSTVDVGYPEASITGCTGPSCPLGSCSSRSSCESTYPRPFADGAYTYCGQKDDSYCIHGTTSEGSTIRTDAYILTCRSGSLSIARCVRTTGCTYFVNQAVCDL